MQRPRRVRHDLVHPSAVAQHFTPVLVRQLQWRVVLFALVVREDADQEVHGGEGELGLPQLQDVSSGIPVSTSRHGSRYESAIPWCQWPEDPVHVHSPCTRVVPPSTGL